jgi:hypothetical protein
MKMFVRALVLLVALVVNLSSPAIATEPPCICIRVEQGPFQGKVGKACSKLPRMEEYSCCVFSGESAFRTPIPKPNDPANSIADGQAECAPCKVTCTIAPRQGSGVAVTPDPIQRFFGYRTGRDW